MNYITDMHLTAADVDAIYCVPTAMHLERLAGDLGTHPGCVRLHQNCRQSVGYSIFLGGSIPLR